MHRVVHKAISSGQVVQTNTTISLVFGNAQDIQNDTLSTGTCDSYTSCVALADSSTLRSFAFVAKHTTTVYVATRGDCVIYSVIDNNVERLLGGQNYASGILKQNATLFLTTEATIEYMGGDEDFRQFLVDHTPLAAIHYVRETEEPVDLVAVVFSPALQELIATSENTKVLHTAQTHAQKKNTPLLATLPPVPLRFISKSIPWKTFGIVVCACILVAGLVYGIQTSRIQRKQADFQKSLDTLETRLPDTYKQIAKKTFANLSAGQAGFDDLYTQLDTLVSTYGAHPRVETIRTQIQAQEKKLLQKVDSQTSLFFDLSVEDPQWKPIDVAVEEQTAYFLSADAGGIFVLDLQQKSYKVLTDTKLKNSIALAVEDGDIYVLTPSGVMVFQNEKWQMRIPKDITWKSPQDIATFYKNVYILDTQADDIHKYVETGGTYAERTSYFQQDTAYDLDGARRIFIDTAVYVLREEQLDKYISGTRDTFKKEYPFTTPRLTDGTTNGSTLFVLEPRGIIALSDTGSYQKQYMMVTMKPTHIFVAEGVLYGLQGSQVYTIK